MEKSTNDRRQFLRNTSLAALTAAVLPQVALGRTDDQRDKKNEAVACDRTTTDLYGQGPFYTSNAPIIANNLLASSSEVGTRLIVSGRVLNLDCNEYIPNTLVDVWHANDAGAYDNSGFNLRGKTTSAKSTLI